MASFANVISMVTGEDCHLAHYLVTAQGRADEAESRSLNMRNFGPDDCHVVGVANIMTMAMVAVIATQDCCCQCDK